MAMPNPTRTARQPIRRGSVAPTKAARTAMPRAGGRDTIFVEAARDLRMVRVSIGSVVDHVEGACKFVQLSVPETDWLLSALLKARDAVVRFDAAAAEATRCPDANA